VHRLPDLAKPSGLHPFQWPGGGGSTGKQFPGLGNPALLISAVYPYNPDVDIPITCLMCEERGCIEACSRGADPRTKHRRLYRGRQVPVLLTTGPVASAAAPAPKPVRTKRASAPSSPTARPTSRPERTCTPLLGDPQCVKICVQTGPEFTLRRRHRERTPSEQHYGISRDAARKEPGPSSGTEGIWGRHVGKDPRISRSHPGGGPVQQEYPTRSLSPTRTRGIHWTAAGMSFLPTGLKTPGVGALSPENPLLFMPGPFSGFPIPVFVEDRIVTKCARTSPAPIQISSRLRR